MSIIIKYKARITWTDRRTGTYHEDTLCAVVHEVKYQDDGTYVTINLEWVPIVAEKE